MDQKGKEYRQAYKKWFVQNPEPGISALVRSEGDIPVENESYRNVLFHSFAYLSTMSSHDMAMMKILPKYIKLQKRNQSEMPGGSNPIKFAVILFILHHYCVRIERSPWRKDFLTIKAYTGFHQYTFKRWISPGVITELFAMIDFIYNPNLDSFIYSSHASTDFWNIKEAGMEFFLSYTHCMVKNDSQFKKSIRAPKPLPNPTQSVSSMITAQSGSSLEISGASGLSRNSVRPVSSQQPSSSREKQRDKRRPEMQERSMYESAHASGNLYTNTFPRQYDIYNPQDAPIDLSKKIIPVQRKRTDREQTTSRGSPNSDYDDQELYGASDPRGPYNGSHELVSLENSISEKVLYPPNTSPGHGLDAQMENCTVEPLQNMQNNYVKVASHSKKHDDPYISNNYVQVVPSKGRRGSPDGQIAQETRDPLARWPYNRSPHKNSTNRTRERRHEHVYQEINDNDMYGP